MQQTASFVEISAYPERLTTGSILARLVSGVGFRYYWATDGLTESDLRYSPGNNHRDLQQTLNHIYNMVDFVGSILEGKVFDFPEKEYDLDFSEIRTRTLERISDVEQILLAGGENVLEKKTVQITLEGTPMEFSIWHLLNGPLLDSIFHLGQVVTFRRVNGNPIDPCVQPFFGKRIEPN